MGRLTVIDHILRPRSDGRNRRVLKCRCVCGSEVEVLPYNVSSGDTRSCGCLHRQRASEANTTHGLSDRSKGSLYNVWRGMRRRCYSPSAHNYKWYGGKGIEIQWDNFESFAAWSAANGYKPGLQLDRINSDLDYSPDNCWWTTRSDNMMRAHLHIDPDVMAASIALADTEDTTLSNLIEVALKNHLESKKEVMGNVS